jgi:phosphate acetyltransferase
LDAAVDPKAAKKKCPDSPLKGRANTLIFPNLNASNIFGHGLMQFTDLQFQFTVLKGLKKPVGIVGRSTPKEIVKNVILSVAAQ